MHKIIERLLLIAIVLFSGMACFFIVFIMSLEQYDLQDTAKVLTWIFMIFPHFALVKLSTILYYTLLYYLYTSVSESWLGKYQHNNVIQSNL